MSSIVMWPAEDELAARQATGAAATTSCRQGDKGAEGQQPGARVRRRSSDMEEERIREAAWRWRFGRRWCAEQVSRSRLHLKLKG